MSKLLAVLIGIFGVIAGVVSWLFVIASGIVDIVDAAKTSPVSSNGIAWGVVQVIAAEFIGYGVGFVIIAIAFFVYDAGDNPPLRGRPSPMGSSAWRAEHDWNQRMHG